MEKKDEEKGLTSNIVLGCHGNSGGARPKVVKQPESTYSQSTEPAIDARVKAQQVAEKLRRKYCQSDEEVKPRQRDAKPPRSPVLCARRRRARAGAAPMCQGLQSPTPLPFKENCDRVSESVCHPEKVVKPNPSDLWKGQRSQRSNREDNGHGRSEDSSRGFGRSDCNGRGCGRSACSSRGYGRSDCGSRGYGRSNWDITGGQMCRKRSNCSRQKGLGKGRSKFDTWKSRGLSSNWMIRTLADKETASGCDTDCGTVTQCGDGTSCGSDYGSTRETCLSHCGVAKDDDASVKTCDRSEPEGCDDPADSWVKSADNKVIHGEDTTSDVPASCPQLGPCHSSSAVSLPSMTSSGSDAVLADQSSVTETSDSAVDGAEGINEILQPLDRNCTGAMHDGQDKVCLCLTPRISKTSCARKACNHSWCMACRLPLTPCQFCRSRTLPSFRPFRQEQVVHQTYSDTHEKVCSSSAQQVVNLPPRTPVTTAKQSSSDSEQMHDACASAISTSAQPPAHKHKRKRLSYSKDHGVACPLLEDEHCVCTTDQSLVTECTQDDSDEWQSLSSEEQGSAGENDDRLDSLLNSLLISLHHYSDHDLFMDYLSLNIPSEYHWSAEGNKSEVVREGTEYGEEEDNHDLLSDSSTLNLPLSDTEATDGEDGGLSSFVDDCGEESGDADDEFECDCPHCQCLTVDTDLDLPHHGNINEENGEQLLLESLLSGLREEIAVWEITNSVRVQLLTAMFEFLTSFHGDAPPPATEEAIASIPRLDVDESHIDQELCCAVCLCRCELGDHLSRLPCSHLFHPACIGAWLSKSATCPVCRQAL